MSWTDHWNRWRNHAFIEDAWKEKLHELDETNAEEYFYQYLAFGTGGMRGEIGPGTNRMNTYTIRRAAEGLARYIENAGAKAKSRGVAIAFDPRHYSEKFALETAQTLGAHGIQVYLFEDLRPTPELSFAVRRTYAFAGVVITASHNPPEYNGFKVYGEDGGQFPPGPADELIACVESVENELEIRVKDSGSMQEEGLLVMLGEETDAAYDKALQSILLKPEMIKESGSDLNIVFTPLHGTAKEPVLRSLTEAGFHNVSTVEEQLTPDPEFSTVPSPNPEEKEAFAKAVQIGSESGADILIATDPDADRIGLAAKDSSGEFMVLTGNQTGALLLDYLLMQKTEAGTLPANGIVMKTIVTSELGRAIAEHYGQACEDTLTGFKFIGEKIKMYNETGEYAFQFGYEESYGYLIGDFVRDKDAVQAALLIAEMALWHKKQGRTVYEGLLEIYNRYGYFMEGLDSIMKKGKEGAAQIDHLIETFREDPPVQVSDASIQKLEDYKTGERTYLLENGKKESIQLPSSNVLKFFTDDDSWFCLRPSGTEPKVKFYFGVKGETFKQTEEKLLQLKMDVMAMVHERLED
ncbi:phosphoglucomutase [Marinococcus halophilus]|uniref:Phosphoglucomutase n=1 Tax=Marinococcus halophilus TaxID=1371 RepID=A0A510Y6S8_MARHA|nr:phospho-sugar mutase [Marinococcus halophilus]OZT81140.1 phosphoglucomutase [Marinococcus halophilus]GEK58863.1 phosphomannomutase [Marinococcus halophilus]